MYLADVNILVNAYRPDQEHHEESAEWLDALVAGESRFAVCDQVLASFLRIVTNPRFVFDPDPLADALDFAETFRAQPHCVVVSPGFDHWTIFTRLCREAGTRASLVPDAYLAALAIEWGCEWVTYDRDFSRFKGLRWSTPSEIIARGH
jgi:toxin-antitoxin system PIN domain toxin